MKRRGWLALAGVAAAGNDPDVLHGAAAQNPADVQFAGRGGSLAVSAGSGPLQVPGAHELPEAGVRTSIGTILASCVLPYPCSILLGEKSSGQTGEVHGGGAAAQTSIAISAEGKDPFMPWQDLPASLAPGPCAERPCPARCGFSPRRS